MARSFWVAVEPQLRPTDGAAGHRLLDKGLGHQSHLVQQDPSQGNALDQARTRFVLATEEMKGIANPPGAHDDLIFRPVFLHLENAAQPLWEIAGHVPAQGFDGMAAQGKFLPLEP